MKRTYWKLKPLEDEQWTAEEKITCEVTGEMNDKTKVKHFLQKVLSFYNKNSKTLQEPWNLQVFTLLTQVLRAFE